MRQRNYRQGVEERRPDKRLFIIKPVRFDVGMTQHCRDRGGGISYWIECGGW